MPSPVLQSLCLPIEEYVVLQASCIVKVKLIANYRASVFISLIEPIFAFANFMVYIGVSKIYCQSVWHRNQCVGFICGLATCVTYTAHLIAFLSQERGAVYKLYIDGNLNRANQTPMNRQFTSTTRGNRASKVRQTH